jgi:hypothetical protein
MAKIGHLIYNKPALVTVGLWIAVARWNVCMPRCTQAKKRTSGCCDTRSTNRSLAGVERMLNGAAQLQKQNPDIHVINFGLSYL